VLVKAIEESARLQV